MRRRTPKISEPGPLRPLVAPRASVVEHDSRRVVMATTCRSPPAVRRGRGPVRRRPSPTTRTTSPVAVTWITVDSRAAPAGSPPTRPIGRWLIRRPQRHSALRGPASAAAAAGAGGGRCRPVPGRASPAPRMSSGIGRDAAVQGGGAGGWLAAGLRVGSAPGRTGPR